MFYYTDYIPAMDTRRVIAYDEQKHGMPRVVSPDHTFLFHGAVSTCRVYNTKADALAAWGKHSNKPVVMPDGSTITPAHYFGLERIEDVFIPWSDVKGERWPSEY